MRKQTQNKQNKDTEEFVYRFCPMKQDVKIWLTLSLLSAFNWQNFELHLSYFLKNAYKSVVH